MVLISIPESIDNRTREDQNNVGERIRALQSDEARAERESLKSVISQRGR